MPKMTTPNLHYVNTYDLAKSFERAGCPDKRERCEP
jgi:hypothetical protein